MLDIVGTYFNFQNISMSTTTKDFVQMFSTFTISITGHNKKRGTGRRERKREREKERQRERERERERERKRER